MLNRHLIQRGVRKLQRVAKGEALFPDKPADKKRSRRPTMSGYHIAMQSVASMRRPLVIVQVGANDGRINDPIHGFVKRRPDDTRLVLIEPQTHILPYLRESYAFHNDHRVVNCAVGQDDSLTLHVVDDDMWDKIHVPYAKNWPSYRAPTGVTSAHRAEVVNWLARYLPKGMDAEDHVSELKVPCKTLPQLLTDEGLELRADVLQIDAEGFDDEVIYASDIPRLLPSIIFYEAHRLRETEAGRVRHKKLRQHLRRNNYTLVPQKGDMMAILNVTREG